MSGGGSDSGGRGSGGSTRSAVEAPGGNWCTAVLIRSLLYIKKHHINQRSDTSFLPVWQCVLSLCLCVSSRGAAWPRSPWWRRPGWSRASSWCSPSSACSSSWWRWRCPLPSSACASAPTSAWRRSWPAWGLTPVLMPPQPIRLVQPPLAVSQSGAETLSLSSAIGWSHILFRYGRFSDWFVGVFVMFE